MYPCDGCHDVNTVCVLFLGDARDAYRGLPGLSRLSRVDHWMITRFSRGNLGGSLHRPCQYPKLFDNLKFKISKFKIHKHTTIFEDSK
jgi:hypothetical protein